MASMQGSAGDITLTLQSRIQTPDNAASIARLRKLSKENTDSKDKTVALDDAQARKAADKFEALLIHSMLKGMRKTTMSENKSNDRAIYDDMLDEKLADTMIDAGGIGISDQIFAQIRKHKGTDTNPSRTPDDIQRLRGLANQIQRPELSVTDAGTNSFVSANDSVLSNKGNLRFAKGLWSGNPRSELTQKQGAFIQPLLPHAKRNASRLGTSPEAILAIAALESGWGRSPITDKQGNNSHNLFGIKASKSESRFATTLTTEFIGGSPQKLQAKFKAYDSAADSFDGFSEFLLSNPRYSTALKHASNPERFLQELQSAGYATDPRYAVKAISIMRQIAGNPSPL